MKIDMKKVRTYLIKVIVVVVLMGIMTCVSVFAAGFEEGGSADTGNSGSIEDDRDKAHVQQRLNEWCSFVSDGSVGGGLISSAALEKLKAPSDRAKIVDGVPYAKVIDTDKNGRFETREESEQILEYGGYYYYYIKKQMTGSGEKENETAQLRRVYYKYVELKKEELYTNKDNTWV